MPRQVALVLCLGFIAWLLVRDVRRRTSLGWGIWLPTILLLVLASRPITMWFGLQGAIINEDNYLEGSPVDRMFYLFLIVASGIVATWRGVSWSRLFVANAMITLLYLYFAASVLWAEDPFGSFKRLFKDFGLVIVASVILSEKDPIEGIRAVYVRCACVLIPLSLLFIKYYPELGRFYTRTGQATFTGVATQKNSLGELVMVFSVFLIWDAVETRFASETGRWRTRWDYAVLLLMGFWLLNISESKTALVCMLLGMVLIVRGGPLAATAINRTVLVGALSIPFFVFFTQQFSSIMAPLVEALGRDLTFTGRTDIWQAVLAQDLDPVFGNGYWNFWGHHAAAAAVMAAIGTETMPSAHNGYLDIYVDGGVIALGLLFCLLIGKGRQLSRGLRSDWYQRMRFAVLIMVILYNLSESTFFRLSPIWFSTLLMLIGSVALKPAVEASVVNAWAPVPQPAMSSKRKIKC